MTTPVSPRPRSRFWTLWLLAGVVIGAGYLVTSYFRKSGDPKPDPVAAARANSRGVAHMEQFTASDKAAAAFEEAVRLAPDWRPAKINLGIALLNSARDVKDPALDRALGLFTDVLKEEPDNLYAHYCTGVIRLYRNDLEAAHAAFTRVTELDPKDAHAWFYRGKTRPDEPTNPTAKADYQKALDLNPYLNAARYALAQHGHDRDEEKTKALLAEWEKLNDADWKTDADIKYTMMGRYAGVIGASPVGPPESGPLPLFAHAKVTVAPLPGGAEAAVPVADAVANRFGASVTVFDFNRDGKPDVLLPRSNGFVLVRNDGGLAPSAERIGDGTWIGAAVGDFDNDGWPDVVTTGPAGVRLYRNIEGKQFEDKTAEAGFDAVKGVCLGATWVDLDQDGDLDLVVAKYADTPEQAAKLLAGENVDGGGRLVVFVNVGVAPPAPPGAKLPPLTCKFQRATWPDELKLTGPIVGVVASDTDGDGDVDLTVLTDGPNNDIVLNDRLMRFRRMGLPAAGTDRRVVGGLVIDADGDDRSDYFTLAVGQRPTVSLGVPNAVNSPLGTTDSPALRQAHRCDLDLDGRSDVVGLSEDGKPVFLRGDGSGVFRRVPEAFGPDAEKLTGLAGVAVCDFDGDGNPDLLCLAADGLHLFRSLGNGNHGIKLILTGRRHKPDNLRTNADGVGAKLLVHAGTLRTGAENTTLSAGLGQSRLPLHLGLGKETTAEAVRVRWPDGVIQAELNQPADGVVEVVEQNRMPSSCPVLFTWDGRRFVYVTDFLGAGAVGEAGPDGSVRPPRPEESVKIEPHQLAAKDGKFVLKVTEPMDEVVYLDHLRLDVVDHPADVVVFPDERFATAGPQPSQELLVFRDRFAPVKATDHRGRDVTAKLRHRDRDAADGFAVRSWLGYAEEHFVELQFGVPAASRRLFLVLAGWTEYAFPESIYAATQAGVAMLPPVLEQKQPDGSWMSLGDLGFPAGLSRVMTADVTGKLDPAGGPVRIRTNLRVYWDQVFLAPAADATTATVRELPVANAALGHRGICQEVTPGGSGPIEYDYDRRDAVSVTPWKGRLTRFGDVTELLTATDDRHVVAGPGDDVTVEFDAAGLPPVPAGWVRSFVLRSAGFCKDAAPTTVSGGRVGPLPYRGMPAYPYDAGKTPPRVAEYDRQWNTRPANGGR